ncbi:MAG: response regulator [Elusimicrobiota bacterium]
MDNSLRMLVIDDEEDLVTALVERLGYRGIEAEYALDGRTAREKLETNSYDIVILDLKLPGESGAELRDSIARKYPELPILMITGHGAHPESPGSPPLPGGTVLEKPVNLDVLIEKAREMAKKR